MAQAASGRSHRKKRVEELDLLPVMNLFCVIIPFLLFSASFLEITIIEMSPTEGIGQGGAGTTNLAKSEAEVLQPKIIITTEEMFLGTVFGTIPVSDVSMVEREGRIVRTYDYSALGEKLGNLRTELTREFPSIPVNKIIILAQDEIRYENLIDAIDVAREYGFDQPGLQVSAAEVIARQLELMEAVGGTE